MTAMPAWTKLKQVGPTRRRVGAAGTRSSGARPRRRWTFTIATPASRLGRPAGPAGRRAIAARRSPKLATLTIARCPSQSRGMSRKSLGAAITSRRRARLSPRSTTATLGLAIGSWAGPPGRRSTAATQPRLHATSSIARQGFRRVGAMLSWSTVAKPRARAARPPWASSSSIARPGWPLGRRAGTTRRRPFAVARAARSANRTTAKPGCRTATQVGPSRSALTVARTRPWVA
mmetsp:Transcript_106802/g.341138  ORF Transcript_106802/g.341138 Transcript_106802/m.341138 type:complete len:233 (+) Transcript_106802:916-1614(+)